MSDSPTPWKVALKAPCDDTTSSLSKSTTRLVKSRSSGSWSTWKGKSAGRERGVRTAGAGPGRLEDGLPRAVQVVQIRVELVADAAVGPGVEVARGAGLAVAPHLRVPEERLAERDGGCPGRWPGHEELVAAGDRRDGDGVERIEPGGPRRCPHRRRGDPRRRGRGLGPGRDQRRGLGWSAAGQERGDGGAEARPAPVLPGPGRETQDGDHGDAPFGSPGSYGVRSWSPSGVHRSPAGARVSTRWRARAEEVDGLGGRRDGGSR